MKLIIDIDDELVETAKFAVHLDMGSDYVKSIANGIPLDKIRAEIINKSNEPNYLHENEDWSVGLEMALEIIDKYRAESEEV